MHPYSVINAVVLDRRHVEGCVRERGRISESRISAARIPRFRKASPKSLQHYNVESPGDSSRFDQPTDQVSVDAEDLVLGPVVPQNVVRRELLAAMIAWVTERTELGPLLPCRRPDVRESSPAAAMGRGGNSGEGTSAAEAGL